MSKLAERNKKFGVLCVDFLIDMFNDEIEDVRFVPLIETCHHCLSYSLCQHVFSLLFCTASASVWNVYICSTLVCMWSVVFSIIDC